MIPCVHGVVDPRRAARRRSLPSLACRTTTIDVATRTGARDGTIDFGTRTDARTGSSACTSSRIEPHAYHHQPERRFADDVP